MNCSVVIFKLRCLSIYLFFLLKMKKTSIGNLEWKLVWSVCLSALCPNSIPEVNFSVKEKDPGSQILTRYLSYILSKNVINKTVLMWDIFMIKHKDWLGKKENIVFWFKATPHNITDEAERKISCSRILALTFKPCREVKV